MTIDDAMNVMWLGLAFLFVVGGGALAYALWRVGRTLRGIEGDLHRTVDEVVPLIGKVSVSMDTVNDQLQKVDVMMDSAVDMTDAVDTAVRAVSMAVTEPVKKVSGVFAGMEEAVASFRDRVVGEEEEAEPAGAAGPTPAPAPAAPVMPADVVRRTDVVTPADGDAEPATGSA